MEYLFEYSDMLNAPVEAFLYDTRKHPFPIQSHWHYFIEIIYVMEGTACITCNQSTYILNPGELIFLPPQAIHAIYTTTPFPLTYTVLKFDSNHINLSGDYLPKIGSLFRSTLRKQNIPLIFSQEDFTGFSLSDFFEKCVTEIDTKEYGYDSFLASYISMFLIELLRIWRAQGFISESETYEQKEDYSIHDILMYIDSHSHEKIEVQKLASMCHMSYSYFAKTFHRLYGQSCKEYIEFVRLSKVENLLLFTDYDLNYISAETGFADCSHLIRVFKRKYHTTPKQFRLEHRTPKHNADI